MDAAAAGPVIRETDACGDCCPPCAPQVEPLRFGSWARYAVALSAPGAAGFPAPYTFSLAAAGPFTQAAGASEWGAQLQGGKVCLMTLPLEVQTLPGSPMGLGGASICRAARCAVMTYSLRCKPCQGSQ